MNLAGIIGLFKGKLEKMFVVRYTLGVDTETEGLKLCRGCKSWLPRDRFFARQKSRDGLQSRCRSCMSKKRIKSPGRKTWSMSLGCDAREAHVAVKAAVLRGILVRGDCESCGDPPTIVRRRGPRGPRTSMCAHHEDYGSPLAVRWFCMWCHGSDAHGAKDDSPLVLPPEPIVPAAFQRERQDDFVKSVDDRLDSQEIAAKIDWSDSVLWKWRTMVSCGAMSKAGVAAGTSRQAVHSSVKKVHKRFRKVRPIEYDRPWRDVFVKKIPSAVPEKSTRRSARTDTPRAKYGTVSVDISRAIGVLEPGDYSTGFLCKHANVVAAQLAYYEKIMAKEHGMKRLCRGWWRKSAIAKEQAK